MQDFHEYRAILNLHCLTVHERLSVMTFDGTFFSTGDFENKVILDFFHSQHCITVSLPIVKRRLNNCGFKGRKTVFVNQELRAMIVLGKILSPGPLRAVGQAVWYVL